MKNIKKNDEVNNAIVVTELEKDLENAQQALQQSSQQTTRLEGVVLFLTQKIQDLKRKGREATKEEGK
jgi:phage shock protein A